MPPCSLRTETIGKKRIEPKQRPKSLRGRLFRYSNCAKREYYLLMKHPDLERNGKEMNSGVNTMKLTGTVSEPPVYDHTLLGEAFYRMTVKAVRLSGVCDELPVTVSERLLGTAEEHPTEPGTRVSITGQIRSYNRHDETGSHLIITVFAREIEFPEAPPAAEPEECEAQYAEEDVNETELIGRICKPVIYRTTPFSREIADILLAVGRRYGKSDYLPCIAWGRNARYAGELSVNDMLLIRGRMQSREYQKTLPDGSVEQRTAYEISISALERIEDQSF